MKTKEKEAPKARTLLRPIRVGKPGGVSFQDIRTLAKNHPAEFMRKAQMTIDEGKLSLAGIRDIKSLYRALADVPVEVVMPDAAGNERAIQTSAFPVLVGNTIVKAINDRYESFPKVADRLVTDLEDNKAVTVIARIAPANKDYDRVKEGDDFPEVSVTEDTVEIGEWPNGRILKIGANAIARNDVANIVERVNFLADYAAKFVEKHTLQLVTDVYGSAASAAAPYVYRPNGTDTALFSATANTPGKRAPLGTEVQSNALADETDLTAARTRLGAMRDDEGDPIGMETNSLVALVPLALEDVAFKIKNSELIPSSTGSNTVSNWGPKGKYAGWEPVVSPYLDTYSTGGTTTWYFGQPRKQFVRKWALRMEYVTLGENTQAYLQNRTAFQARIAWNCHVGARDYVYWVRCLSATTPPAK